MEVVVLQDGIVEMVGMVVVLELQDHLEVDRLVEMVVNPCQQDS